MCSAQPETSFLFFCPYCKMQLYEEISKVFKLKTLNVSKQTKKTLLKWVQETKFCQRRARFYENNDKKRFVSRVSMCTDTKNRPEWTKTVENLKVGALRKAIKSFLI